MQNVQLLAGRSTFMSAAVRAVLCGRETHLIKLIAKSAGQVRSSGAPRCAIDLMLDMIACCLMAYAAASRFYTRRKIVGEPRCLAQKESRTHTPLRHVHARHDVCHAPVNSFAGVFAPSIVLSNKSRKLRCGLARNYCIEMWLIDCIAIATVWHMRSALLAG